MSGRANGSAESEALASCDWARLGVGLNTPTVRGMAIVRTAVAVSSAFRAKSRLRSMR